MPAARNVTAARKTPKRFRVLYTDLAGDGRFRDVEADSEGEAAWKAAIDLERGNFVGIITIPADQP